MSVVYVTANQLRKATIFVIALPRQVVGLEFISLRARPSVCIILPLISLHRATERQEMAITLLQFPLFPLLLLNETLSGFLQLFLS